MRYRWSALVHPEVWSSYEREEHTGELQGLVVVDGFVKGVLLRDNGLLELVPYNELMAIQTEGATQ